jgi:hypothetical protein
MILGVFHLPRGDAYALHIYRREGDQLDNSVNTYEAELGMKRATFKHRYGDGWERCVERALVALRREYG